MPYIDINPHRRRCPKWVSYIALIVLTTLTATVVVLALTAG